MREGEGSSESVFPFSMLPDLQWERRKEKDPTFKLNSPRVLRKMSSCFSSKSETSRGIELRGKAEIKLNFFLITTVCLRREMEMEWRLRLRLPSKSNPPLPPTYRVSHLTFDFSPLSSGQTSWVDPAPNGVEGAYWFLENSILPFNYQTFLTVSTTSSLTFIQASFLELWIRN